jgi:hypothetical protein
LELALGAQVGEELGLALVLAVGNIVSVDPAKVRGAPGAGDACSSAAARGSAAASPTAPARVPTAPATTSAASVCSDCADCSNLGVGTEHLVRVFVLHESGVKFLEPLRVLHEASGLEQAADGQRERMFGSVLLVDPVDSFVDDVAVPVC